MSVSELVAPSTGLARLWRRLAHPIDPIACADVLVGLPPDTTRQLLAVSLASSPEADALLDGMPHVLRSLAVSTTSVPIRCDGELRGPVMWSATMAARSASPGAGNVFVCAAPIKAYDTPENQVLVAALARIVRAAKTAEAAIEGPHTPPSYDVRRAQHNGERAREALAHRALETVRRVPIDGRMLHKARTGTKAAVFRDAVDLVARSWSQVGADDLAALVDEDTRAEHAFAADVLDVLTSRGLVSERLRVSDGRAASGPFAYRRGAVAVDGRSVSSLTEL